MIAPFDVKEQEQAKPKKGLSVYIKEEVDKMILAYEALDKAIRKADVKARKFNHK